jgi:hypothetical protein
MRHVARMHVPHDPQVDAVLQLGVGIRLAGAFDVQWAAMTLRSHTANSAAAADSGAAALGALCAEWGLPHPWDGEAAPVLDGDDERCGCM